MRKRVDNVQCLLTAKRNIMLDEGQHFSRFNSFWEVWGPKDIGGHIQCLERIPEDQVIWVIEKPQSAEACTI